MKTRRSNTVRRTIAMIAAEHLRETGNDALMWGDISLLHQIAIKCGMESQGVRTERRVMNAIDRDRHRLFTKRLTRGGGRSGRQWVRVFRLANVAADERR